MHRLFLLPLLLTLLPTSSAQHRAEPPTPSESERTECYTYDPTTGAPTLTPEAAAAYFERHAEHRATARAEADRAAGVTSGARLPIPPASRGGGLFTVTTAFDTGDTNPGDGACIASGFLNGCTLRAAIEEANATPGTDPVFIEFDILLGPSGSDLGLGRWRIQPGSALPLITRENTTVNALSQSNAVCGILTAGGPFAVPHNLKVVLDGSLLTASGSGLSASSLAANIDIRGFVVQNFPGYGIVTGGAGSEVECNYVGTSLNGTGAAPNADGVLVGGFFVSPGAVEVRNNLVSGNDDDGVFVSRNLAEVRDNLVGTNSSGTNPLGNGGAGLFGNGIFVSGDDVTVDGNVASANNGDGIVLGSSDGLFGGMIHAERAVVTNNTVGLTRRGLRNGVGNSVSGIFVGLFEPSDNDVGLPGGGNLIGDNGSSGVFVRGIGNRVRGNVVGLDANAVPAPNQTGVYIGGTDNTVQNNTISGNSGDGIYFGTWNAVIEDNRIGTDAAITTTRPNGGNGIYLFRADGATINGNTIGGNLEAGIYLSSSSNVTAEGNLIGTNATRSIDLGNGQDGISCTTLTDNVHLGRHGNANVIGFNGGDGIRIGDSCQDISLISNALFDNGGLGIDLGADGVTLNDPGDGDGGANGLQNYPGITRATNDGADAVIDWTFNSLPNRTFELLFCHVPIADPSGHGECDDPDIIELVTTDGSGNAAGSVTAPAAQFPVGHWVAATATVAIGALPAGYGPTSELSQAVGVQAVTPPGVFLSATNTTPLTVAPGGSISFDYTVQNTTVSPVTGDLFYTVSPGELSAVIASGTVPAGQTVNGSLVQNVPGNAPPGTYTYTLRIGQFPNTTVDSEAFTVTVTGPARWGRSETWAVTDALPWQPMEAAAGPETASQSDEALPNEAALTGAYPNPFRRSATVLFTLPEAADVRLAVYDVLGREVARLVDGVAEAGRHEAVIDGETLPSGVYVVRLESGGGVEMQRLTLVR